MKRFLPLIITLALGQALQAQKMRDVFAAMPDSVLGIMTKNNRLDCIDFIENDMEAKVRNRFDGFSVLKALTVDYLDLQLTPNCRVEMKLLPAEDTLNYICVARTYSGPVTETKVTLYAPDWNVLPEEKWIPFPAYADFWETAAFAGHALCDGFPATGRYAADFCFAARRSGQGGGGAYEKGFTSCRI